ncbi:MAG TPA: sulfurtransferase [Gammaproteobacteria bacterium]
MNDTRLPLLIEPAQLQPVLQQPNILIVDLCKAETYLQAHVPGAVHLDYSRIVTALPPVMGLVPDIAQLNGVLSQIGAMPACHIIAYDDEGGGKAARLLYTLDIMGHDKYSLLNGGLHAWANEGYPLESTPNTKPASHYQSNLQEQPIATRQFILSHLDDDSVQFIDTRTSGEFTGARKMADKGGHIPGALNIDWLLLMDRQKNLRLKSDTELQALLNEHGVAPDKTTVVYCQSHHRSALTYIALKHLGFKDVKGYPGAWSDWGNNPDTPVETGSVVSI